MTDEMNQQADNKSKYIEYQVFPDPVFVRQSSDRGLYRESPPG